MPDPVPFFMTKPLLRIGDDTTPIIELQCAANNVVLSPDQDENDYETFCGTYSTYGPEKWTLTATVLQSFGADGVWTKLRPIAGTVVPFELRPNADAAPSVDNPAQTGTALLKAFPFWDGAVNEPAEIDIELKVQGELTEVTTGTLTAPAAATSS